MLYQGQIHASQISTFLRVLSYDLKLHQILLDCQVSYDFQVLLYFPFNTLYYRNMQEYN